MVPAIIGGLGSACHGGSRMHLVQALRFADGKTEAQRKAVTSEKGRTTLGG